MKAEYIKDYNPSTSKMFNDAANGQWTDTIPFNIFNADGYLTEDAKAFIMNNKEALSPFKKNGTWADAILDYSEFRGIGQQLDKGAPLRSDTSYSGSMNMDSHMIASDRGDSYDPQKYQNNNIVKDNSYESTELER